MPLRLPRRLFPGNFGSYRLACRTISPVSILLYSCWMCLPCSYHPADCLGYGWKNFCRERSFDMLILLGTFVLPQLAAFPVTALGWNPLDYQFTWPGWNLSALWAEAPVRTAAVFFALAIASVGIGLLWNKKRWIIYAALFWGVYVFFYTSLFSNWQGFFAGTVGALGYWLATARRSPRRSTLVLLSAYPNTQSMNSYLAFGPLPGSVFWPTSKIPCPARRWMTP